MNSTLIILILALGAFAVNPDVSINATAYGHGIYADNWNPDHMMIQMCGDYDFKGKCAVAPIHAGGGGSVDLHSQVNHCISLPKSGSSFIDEYGPTEFMILSAKAGTEFQCSAFKTYDCKNRLGFNGAPYVIDSIGYRNNMAALIAPFFKRFRCWNATEHPAPSFTTTTRATSTLPCTQSQGRQTLELPSYTTSDTQPTPPDRQNVPGECSALAAMTTAAS